MNFVEYPVAGQVGLSAEKSAGTFRRFHSRLLTDIVDAIWDVDIPDSDTAGALAIKFAPGNSLLLMAQYRTPALVRQGHQDLPSKCATQIQASSVTLRPAGALGLIVVCLRPDAANRIVEAPLGQFANANIPLANVFSRGDVSTCDELLVEARDSPERVATVEGFLLRRVRPQRDGLACRAASHLTSDPSLPLQQLASRLDVSMRQLSRSFSATFGICPKRFARLARFEKVVAERRKGLSWAEIACACDFTDQAHLVRDFRDIVGEVPTEFFAQEMGACIGMTEANFVIQRAVEKPRA